jgi:hypothetical protein
MIIMEKKTEWENELKFCTQVKGLNLYQIEHKSCNNISSPVMSKKTTEESL